MAGRLITIPLVATCALVSPQRNTHAQGNDASPLRLALEEARRGGTDAAVTYERPSPARRALEQLWFTGILSCARLGDERCLLSLRAPGAWLGLSTRFVEDQGRPLLVVSEAPGARRGAGVYAIRVGPAASEALVAAPHSFSDLGTLELAIAFHRLADARVLAVNTVHRKGGARLPCRRHEEKRQERSATLPVEGGPADVAHDRESTFQAFTLAWLAQKTGGSMLQVHGFADGRVPADLVFSIGAKVPPPGWLQDLAREVSGLIPGFRVALFPTHVRSFGALTNVQGQAARRAGVRFLHVEMSASLRKELVAVPREARAFFLALAQVLREEHGDSAR